MRLAQRETQQTMIPAFSRISSAPWTQAICLKGKLYDLYEIGRLSPVSMLMVTRSVCPPESDEYI